MEVRAYYEMLENDEDSTACRDVEDDGENEFECRSRCRLNMIRVKILHYSQFFVSVTHTRKLRT